MKNLFKYSIGLISVLFLRLIPHPPNVEPIMSTMMPFSKRWGAFAGVLFTFLAMFLFDLITGTLGLWSIFTIGTYCLLAAVAPFFLRNRSSVVSFVAFAVVGTIVYDFITGVIGSYVFFGMPISVALAGQVPFTLYHLAGNMVLSAIISPLLYSWVLDNPRLEYDRVRAYFAFRA